MIKKLLKTFLFLLYIYIYVPMYIPPTIYYSVGDTKYLILCPITSEKIKLRNMILFLLTSFVRNIITCSSCLVPYARLKLKIGRAHV